MNNGILILLCLLSYSGLSQVKGSFTDLRDGQIYATATYKFEEKGNTKTISWFAENLKFATNGSICYQNGKDNCERFGRYYQWHDAMNSCPLGWRLPNDQDWIQLVNFYGGKKKAGRHLKSKNEFWPNGNGTNKSGFSGKAYGASDGGEFFQVGYAAFFWSATLVSGNDEEAYDWSFVTNSSEVRQWGGYKLIYNCVRCVKDEE